MFSRNSFRVRHMTKCVVLHSAVWKNSEFPLTKMIDFFSKSGAFTKFLLKSVRVNSRNFQTLSWEWISNFFHTDFQNSVLSETIFYTKQIKQWIDITKKYVQTYNMLIFSKPFVDSLLQFDIVRTGHFLSGALSFVTVTWWWIKCMLPFLRLRPFTVAHFSLMHV